jgi:hypothetical protein
LLFLFLIYLFYEKQSAILKEGVKEKKRQPPFKGGVGKNFFLESCTKKKKHNNTKD